MGEYSCGFCHPGKDHNGYSQSTPCEHCLLPPLVKAIQSLSETAKKEVA